MSQHETVYLVYHTSEHIANTQYRFDQGPVLIYENTDVLYRESNADFTDLIADTIAVSVYMNKDDINSGSDVISTLKYNHPYGPGIKVIYEAWVSLKDLVKYVDDYEKYLNKIT